MSAAQTSTSSRSRNPARKKPNDDAPYFGPPASTSQGNKRQAVDKVDGEPRLKRKRVDIVAAATAVIEQRASIVEFVKLPTPVLYRYLAQFDIIPRIYPSPLSPEDPPPPASLMHPYHHPSRAVPSPPPATPANRPRRDPKEQTRRRSSRLLEEDVRPRTPVLADVEELHVILAGMAEHHFQDLAAMGGREEVDTLVSFMCAVEKVKAARHR